MFRTIIWATDGSELADSAVPLVQALAHTHGSSVVALHANTTGTEVPSGLDAQVERLCADGLDASLQVVPTSGRPPARVIADVAREIDADLIVVATHAYGLAGSIFAGRTAKSLVHEASCPVLTVPPRVRALA